MRELKKNINISYYTQCLSHRALIKNDGDDGKNDDDDFDDYGDHSECDDDNSNEGINNGGNADDVNSYGFKKL